HLQFIHISTLPILLAPYPLLVALPISSRPSIPPAPSCCSGSSPPPTSDDHSASPATGPSTPGAVSCPSTPPPRPCSTGSFTTPSDRKSTRLNSSHGSISYAVFCLKKKY